MHSPVGNSLIGSHRYVQVLKLVALALVLPNLASTVIAQNELRIRDLCRIKGQETNTLQGVGIVVGLKGTGDGDSKPMARALARMMSLMGAPIAADVQGQLQTADIENSKNVAMVFVTATVPAGGSQPGDHLDCTVSAIKAKSLEGGQLLLTPLLGPRPDSPVVYAMASGAVSLENAALQTTGKISAGCKMEMAVQTNFVESNTFTLILDADHSSFGTAQYIEDRVNDEYRMGIGGGTSTSQMEVPATALDQLHVQVRIPKTYADRPVQFISLILDLPVVNLRGNKRVVIREREGIVVIGDDVTISPVAISHKNLTISAGGKGGGGSFVGTTTTGVPAEMPTLQNLVNSLNVLSVPTDDIIAIIKALKRQGNLYGELVIE